MSTRIHGHYHSCSHHYNNRITKTDSATNQTTHYIYNSEQRLIRLEQHNNDTQIKTTLADYTYDPFGRRISKTSNGHTTYYLYSQEGLIAEYDETGTLKTEYHYQPNATWMTNPLFMRTDSNQQNTDEILYYYNDHLGTPQALRDKGGRLHWLANYAAFGEAQIQTLFQPQYQVTQNLRFLGQYFDQESGLHQNYYRDYEPTTGRYVETDPIGLDGGINTYGYAYQNPVNYLDFFGLDAECRRKAFAEVDACRKVVTKLGFYCETSCILTLTLKSRKVYKICMRACEGADDGAHDKCTFYYFALLDKCDEDDELCKYRKYEGTE